MSKNFNYKSSINVEKASQEYNISGWGEGFFSINDIGDVVVKLNEAEISLRKIVLDLKSKGINTPVLLRFLELATTKIMSLYSSFNNAIKKRDYQGKYKLVYPVKVNQSRDLVEHLVKIDKKYLGLEVGTKAEFMLALSLLSTGGTILCNGYKDKQFLELACLASKIGFDVWIILENFIELECFLSIKDSYDVLPRLGIRYRLSTPSCGHWQNTGGKFSKFGFDSNGLQLVVEKLKAANILSRVQMLHCHCGSQISNLEEFERCLSEFVSVYSNMSILGLSIKVLNFGGGLAVDYDGAKSSDVFSKNYSFDEYADLLVRLIKDKSNSEFEPDIFTESGRAVVSNHAVLVTDVVDIELMPHNKQVVLSAELEDILQGDPLEAYYKASYFRDRNLKNFVDGKIDIKQQADLENQLFYFYYKLASMLDLNIESHRQLSKKLDMIDCIKLICNFSVFRSIPDAWALNQVFPIMPINGFNKCLTNKAVVHDVTCDSDGQVKNYISKYGTRGYMNIPDKTNMIGIFLIGAYQEVLGDIHNLYGEVTTVNFNLKDGKFVISESCCGETVGAVIEKVGFSSKKVIDSIAEKIEKTSLLQKHKIVYQKLLNDIIFGYTYLG